MSGKELIHDEISEKIIDITARMAIADGANTITVSKILRELGATNRVFYNRFHNLDEVLEIVYKNEMRNMHDTINSDYSLYKNFFEYVTDIATKVLINTYEKRLHFSSYMFDHDSLTQDNYEWWISKMKRFIKFGINCGLIKKDANPDALSYSFWCFCRGFCADAVTRNLSQDEATKYFQYGINCILDSIKNKN